MLPDSTEPHAPFDRQPFQADLPSRKRPTEDEMADVRARDFRSPFKVPMLPLRKSPRPSYQRASSRGSPPRSRDQSRQRRPSPTFPRRRSPPRRQQPPWQPPWQKQSPPRRQQPPGLQLSQLPFASGASGYTAQAPLVPSTSGVRRSGSPHNIYGLPRPDTAMTSASHVSRRSQSTANRQQDDSDDSDDSQHRRRDYRSCYSRR